LLPQIAVQDEKEGEKKLLVVAGQETRSGPAEESSAHALIKFSRCTVDPDKSNGVV
jgi:hypothetical protein